MSLDNETVVSEILTNYFSNFLNKKIGECSVNVKMKNIINSQNYLQEHHIYCSIGMNNQIYEITIAPISKTEIYLESFNETEYGYDDISKIINIFERHLIKELDKITLSIKLDLLTIGDKNAKSLK